MEAIRIKWLAIEKQLKAAFPEDKVKFYPGKMTKSKDKALAFPYIDARDVQKRLDDVFGVGGWQAKYSHGGGKVSICEISCLMPMPGGELEWVTKANGAGESEIEGEKGSLSDALKRAASVWGVGRYLYFVDTGKWLPIDKYKKFINPPKLPAWAKPKKEK